MSRYTIKNIQNSVSSFIVILLNITVIVNFRGSVFHNTKVKFQFYVNCISDFQERQSVRQVTRKVHASFKLESIYSMNLNTNL